MRLKSWLLAIPAALSLAGAAGAVAVSFETFRTLAVFVGVTQGADGVTGAPQFDPVVFDGHTLVNLAMGRPAGDTSHLEQVFAMTIACDLSSADLVVFDRHASNTIATIAESTSFDSIRAQGPHATAPDRARFVARFDVDEKGGVANGIAGGFFTVAGRVHLDEQTGCPTPVLVSLDKDKDDKLYGDAEVPDKSDPDTVRDVMRTGRAHLIGVLDVNTGDVTRQVLVPFGRLSIRRALPDAA